MAQINELGSNCSLYHIPQIYPILAVSSPKFEKLVWRNEIRLQQSRRCSEKRLFWAPRQKFSFESGKKIEEALDKDFVKKLLLGSKINRSYSMYEACTISNWPKPDIVLIIFEKWHFL